MKLYSSRLSPNSKRARIAALECGATVEIVELDFAKGEARRPEYLAKNPMGKVPTLEDGDFVLWESPAILCYLASKHPEKKLFPRDPAGQAEVLRWMFWNASHFEPAIFGIAMERLFKPMMGGQPDQAVVDKGLKDIARYAPVLDAHLEGKDFLLGDKLTIADIDLGVPTDTAVVAQVDLSRYRNLKPWLSRLQSREAWKKA